MKIILSRKGFDDKNGGIPSPILPDGTLLSMPIPAKDDKASFDGLALNGIKYSDLLDDLNPNGAYQYCHVDPDIRDNCRIHPVPGWKPAFGQCGSAQGLLANAGVSIGDIFLFFGWFRQIEEYKGKYRYVRKACRDFYSYADLQVIYGYMQVGDILVGKASMTDYSWHPHSAYTDKNNVLYLPSDRLSLNPELKGYGTLNFRKDRVLTMEGKSRAKWTHYPFLMPDHVYGNKHNACNDALYYQGVWQELVISESDGLLDWVKAVIS